MIISVFDKVVNIVEKGENAGYQLFLLFQQRVEKASFPDTSKSVIVWEWVKKTWETENSHAGKLNQHFIVFPQCFLSYQRKNLIIFLATLNWSSAFNSRKSVQFSTELGFCNTILSFYHHEERSHLKALWEKKKYYTILSFHDPDERMHLITLLEKMTVGNH